MSANVFPTPPWPDVPGVVYGRDLSCFLRDVTLEMPDGSFRTSRAFDLSQDMAEVDGRLGYAESLARRLVTYAGTLLDDRDYGRDLQGYVNDDLTPRDLAKIAAGAEEELLKDERTVVARATAQLVNGVLVVSINVIDGVGPFKLTLTADAFDVTVLFSGL